MVIMMSSIFWDVVRLIRQKMMNIYRTTHRYNSEDSTRTILKNEFKIS